MRVAQAIARGASRKFSAPRTSSNIPNALVNVAALGCVPLTARRGECRTTPPPRDGSMYDSPRTPGITAVACAPGAPHPGHHGTRPVPGCAYHARLHLPYMEGNVVLGHDFGLAFHTTLNIVQLFRTAAAVVTCCSVRCPCHVSRHCSSYAQAPKFAQNGVLGQSGTHFENLRFMARAPSTLYGARPDRSGLALGVGPASLSHLVAYARHSYSTLRKIILRNYRCDLGIDRVIIRSEHQVLAQVCQSVSARMPEADPL